MPPVSVLSSVTAGALNTLLKIQPLSLPGMLWRKNSGYRLSNRYMLIYTSG